MAVYYGPPFRPCNDRKAQIKLSCRAGVFGLESEGGQAKGTVGAPALAGPLRQNVWFWQ
jgi:hypothetical protein